MIILKNISKKFVAGKDITEALKNINLEISEGEFLTIKGPSGSGKSTLLNIIGGLDTPTEGSVFLKNKDISTFSDKELSKYRNHEIGFVFQEFNLDKSLSVIENILLPTHFNSSSKNARKRAEKLLEQVDLSAKTNSKISELSGGQKQRVAIARALINSPNIILADEPTGNLDLATGETIIRLLADLHETYNTTLIIATHDNEIARFAKKSILMEDGCLLK